MLESEFQRRLIKEIKDKLPGCMVLKNDANYIQGIPDLTVLYRDKWAFLELKKERKASRRPNQPYYIDRANEYAYGAIVSPENKEDILRELQQALQPRREARVSRRE